jgi:hypothetical protein
MSNPHALTPAAAIVVRLYRCDPARQDAMAGTAEIIATGQSASFADGAALLAILHAAARGTALPAQDAAADPNPAPAPLAPAAD